MAARIVLEAIAVRFYRHARVEIRQAEEPTGGPHRGQTGRIQTEEVHARRSVECYIGTDIQFGKPRQAWQRRQPTCVNAAHVKRDDADPATAIVSVEWKLSGHDGPQSVRLDWPVSKQHVTPGLSHDPRTGWQRPRPVGDEFKSGVHADLGYGHDTPRLQSRLT